MLRLRLFGGYAAFQHDAPLPSTRTRKEEWLLALLVLRHAAPVERARLAYLLWPDSTEERALQNLRRSLNDLRRVLGEEASRLLSPTPRTLRFDASSAEIDVLDFDRAIARGDTWGSRAAVDLYRGELLEGCDEDWLLPERAIREAAFLQAIETLAQDALNRQDYAGSSRYLRRLLVLEPGRESAFCVLLRALAAEGDLSGMVEEFRAFRYRLHREMNAVPSRETVSLFQQLRAELRSGGWREKGVPAAGGNVTAPRLPALAFPQPLHRGGRGHPSVSAAVPRPLTRLIGRERELEEAMSRLLHQNVRLVTLTGFGGMGKTRLAAQIAGKLVDEYPPHFADGIWWLGMEEATSGDAIFATIAERLSVPIHGSVSIREQVRHALRGRTLLLVLDNLEQVPDAAETVRELLSEAPGVRCLATSRRVLGLRGEQVLELQPLPDSEALQLFVERAREGSSRFMEDIANQPCVAELCRRLEGVPLALELAAARGALLTPREMLDRLNERFRLLRSSSPDLPLRRRALHAAIEWSYELLPRDAKEMLAQLSVFVGGFTLEDMEAVCEADDVLESVEALRSHSFFRVEAISAAEPSRFLMLDSVREFAAARLRETGERVTSVSRRHAERFLHTARTRLAALRTAGEVTALQALELDGGNLRAAARWARETGMCGPDWIASRLALALGQWRHRRGFVQEAVEAVESGLEALCPDAPADLRADLLRERAGLHLDLRETFSARLRAEDALALSLMQGDTVRHAKAENLLGQAAMFEERFAEARERFARALEEFTRAGLTVEVANLRTNLGVAERRDRSGTAAEREERLRAAKEHLEEALRLRRELQDCRGLAETLNSLGALAFEMGDLGRAEEFYREALACEQELKNTLEVALLLSNLGEVADRCGDALEAVRLFLSSERLLAEVRSPLQSVVAGMASKTVADHGLDIEVLAEVRMELERLASPEA